MPGEQGPVLRRRCAVVGDPAGHSLSPAIHQAGYDDAGLDWSYEACTVAPGQLAAFVTARMIDPAWAGLSVTAPHKEAIIAFGEPDEPTRLVGGGNTLIMGEAPRVHNTDVPGFVRAWREHRQPVPSRAAIAGNGATARSVMLALAGLGTRDVTVLARDPGRAQSLLDLARDLGIHTQVQVLGSDIDPVELVVNTIPAAAVEASAARMVAATRAVFDVVYDPWPTPLGAEAARSGVTALNGLDLLAGQAVDQFYLMTGHRVTFAVCRSAAEQELKRRARL